MSDSSEVYSDEEWRAILDRIADMYGIRIEPGAELAPTSIRGLLTTNSIPSTVVGDDLPAHVKQSIDAQPPFRYHHVEPLLEEAASLLDRAIATDNQLFQLRIEHFRARSEVIEFFALDRIHGEEIDSGLYNINYQQALGEYNAQIKLSDRSNELRAAYDLLVSLVKTKKGPSFDEKNRAEQGNTAVAEAANSILPYYTPDKKAQVSVIKRGPNKDVDPEGEAQTLAKKRFDWDWDTQARRERVGRIQAENAIDSSRERVSAFEAQQGYLQREAEFKTRRRDVARAMMQIKFDELTRRGGILSYAEKADALRQRGRDDLSNAYARMQAVGLGLKEVYGIDLSPPPSLEGITLDACVSWVREAEEKLAHIARLDQNYVFCVSVRDEVADFSTGIESGWDFRVGVEPFQTDQCLVRLRGIAAYAVDDSGEGFYRLRIRPPPNQMTIYRGSPEAKEMAASTVPVCWLGSVRRRQGTPEFDMTGTQALFNFSPLGEWKVSLLGDSPAKAKSRGLKDIELSLFLAVQPSTF